MLAPHVPDVSCLIFSEIENLNMNSSDDELPDIPGTRYPWMTEAGNEGPSDAGPSHREER